MQAEDPVFYQGGHGEVVEEVGEALGGWVDGWVGRGRRGGLHALLWVTGGWVGGWVGRQKMRSFYQGGHGEVVEEVGEALGGWVGG